MTIRPARPALCQCVQCGKYLAINRPDDNKWVHDACTRCGGEMPLAELRGTLTDPRMIEGLAILSEECAEVQQRIGKILRWGWDADFEGTTQKHKLQLEIADICAVLDLLVHNGIIDEDEVCRLSEVKLDKFREDVAGPRQRLLHLEVPE